MRRRTKGHWSFLAALGLASSIAPGARAQDEAAADTAAARELGKEGVTLADAGNCQDAIDKLARSEKMHHAVSILERLGECQVQLGKFVLGTETLRRVVHEQLPAGAPQVFVDAQERAQRVLTEARPKVARLKVAVAAPADAQIWVTVDGVNEPTANLNSDRFVDPGDHVVEAGAPGYLKATGKVHLGEGGVDSVALTLEVDPNAPKAAPAPTATPAPASPVTESPAPPPERSRDRTFAYIAGGVGLVGVGVGTAFGIGALNSKSNLDSACANRVCPTSEHGELDSGNRFGTISTVGFIVGAVGLAAGAVLYFWDFGGSAKASAYVGPTGAGVSGSF
ncbi:MAG TPA: hypothetical protein VMI75_18695 [Polyangiaceae bacterium]|nr:hypothetical protein [Polyangiaceae bacterium]